MSKKLFCCLILLLFLLPTEAYYPSVEIDFDNARVKSQLEAELEKRFLDFLNDNDEVLIPEGKKYREDQYCSFLIDTDQEFMLDLPSIQLDKHKNNLGYNLKVIEFLRLNNFVVHKRDPDKPIRLIFKYYSF